MSPEVTTTVAFGIVMFLLSIVSVWQNHRERQLQTGAPLLPCYRRVRPPQYPSYELPGSIIPTQYDGVHRRRGGNASHLPHNHNSVDMWRESNSNLRSINASINSWNPTQAEAHHDTTVFMNTAVLAVNDSNGNNVPLNNKDTIRDQSPRPRSPPRVSDLAMAVPVLAIGCSSMTSVNAYQQETSDIGTDGHETTIATNDELHVSRAEHGDALDADRPTEPAHLV